MLGHPWAVFCRDSLANFSACAGREPPIQWPSSRLYEKDSFHERTLTLPSSYLTVKAHGPVSFTCNLARLYPGCCHRLGPSALCSPVSQSPDERNISKNVLNDIPSFSLQKQGLLIYLEETQKLSEHCADDMLIFVCMPMWIFFWRDSLMTLIRLSKGCPGQFWMVFKGRLDSDCLNHTYFHKCMTSGELLIFGGLKFLICNRGIITVPMPGVAVQSKPDHLRCLGNALWTMHVHSSCSVYIFQYSSYWKSP